MKHCASKETGITGNVQNISQKDCYTHSLKPLRFRFINIVPQTLHVHAADKINFFCILY